MRRILIVFLVLLVALAAAPAALAQGDIGGVVAGGERVIRSGETYNGDMVVLGGRLNVQQGGSVNGNVVVMGGNLDLAGTIRGDVAVFGGAAQLRDGSQITGNLSTLGGNINRSPGAQVQGRTISPSPGSRFTPPIAPGAPAPPFQRDDPGAMMWRFLGWVARAFFTTIGLALLAVLAMLLLPRQLSNVTDAMRFSPATSTGVGALTYLVSVVAIPLVAIISALLIIVCIGLLGIPIVIALALALAAALLVGWLATGLILGEWLMRMLNVRDAPLVAAGVGVLILTALSSIIGEIPFLGGLLTWLISLPGLGAVVLTWFGTRTWRPGAPLLPSRGSWGGPSGGGSYGVPSAPSPTPAPGGAAASLPAQTATAAGTAVAGTAGAAAAYDWSRPEPTYPPVSAETEPAAPAIPERVYRKPTIADIMADDIERPHPETAPPVDLPQPDYEGTAPAEALGVSAIESEPEPVQPAAAPPPSSRGVVTEAITEPEPVQPMAPPPPSSRGVVTEAITEATAGATTPLAGDNLVSIPGLTESQVERLNARGVRTYAQLAQLTAGELREIIREPGGGSLTQDEARAVIDMASRLMYGGD